MSPEKASSLPGLSIWGHLLHLGTSAQWGFLGFAGLDGGTAIWHVQSWRAPGVAGSADVYWGGQVVFRPLLHRRDPGTATPPLSLFLRTSLGLCWAMVSRAFHSVVLPASEPAPVSLWPFPVAPGGRKQVLGILVTSPTQQHPMGFKAPVL